MDIVNIYGLYGYCISATVIHSYVGISTIRLFHIIFGKDFASIIAWSNVCTLHIAKSYMF